MGIFDGLLGKRAVTFQSIWGAGEDFASLSSLSNTQVNSETVFQVNAIYSAVSLISDTISTLPVDCFIRRDGARFPFRPKPVWVTRPDIDTTKEGFWGAVIVSLLLDGNAFIRVFSNDRGEVVNLTVLNPHKVEMHRNGLGRVMFEVEGESRMLSADEVIFIPDIVRPGHLRGVSRVEALKEDFGLAIALRNYAAKFFGSGTQPAGIIEVPGNLTGDQAKILQEGFESMHRGWRKSHRPAVISGGAKWVSNQLENDKAQFIDSRRLAVEDVARAFNIPSNLLNLPGTNTYSSVEQNNQAFVTLTIRPLVQKLETAFTPLLSRVQGGDTAFLRFNLDGLLRADMNTRMSAYSTGLQAGFLTINDVRRLEDLTPVNDPSADTVRVPLANVNIDAADLTALNQKTMMVQRLVNSGFKPADVLTALGLGPIEHSGVPPVLLQGVAQINPDDPESVYEA